MDERLSYYVTVIADELRARVVGCWALDGQDVRLRAQLGVDQTVIDAVRTAARAQRKALEAGQRLHVLNGRAWPLLDGSLLGLLFVDNQRTSDAAEDAARNLAGHLALLAENGHEQEHPQRRMVRLALRESGGAVAQAARRLGCSRQTLYAWCARHELDPESFRA